VAGCVLARQSNGTTDDDDTRTLIKLANELGAGRSFRLTEATRQSQMPLRRRWSPYA
jgi:hypothetical protein